MSDIEDDGSHMRSSTYEKEIKDTLIVSTPLESPTYDKMKILMDEIFKRTNKWVEWIRARRKRIGATGSSKNISRGAQMASTPTSTTLVTNSIFMGPSHLVGGGDQPPDDKNVQVKPSCGRGSLPDMGKLRDTKAKKKRRKRKRIQWPRIPLQWY